MPFKRVALYREMVASDLTLPTIFDYVSDTIQADEEHIIKYLQSGNITAIAPGIVSDIFHPDQIIGNLISYTDGEWYWRSDLAYYVKRYHLRLPDDFINYARSMNWEVPKLSPEELLCLE